MSATLIMDGVTEHMEELPVELGWCNGNRVIVAANMAGYNMTMVNVVELISWLKEHAPELLK